MVVGGRKRLRYMRKSELALGAFLIMLVCGASVFILHSTRRDQAIAANADIYKQLDLFGEVLERVRSEYVEKPDDTKLIENAINGMLQGLDPHSSYLTPKEFQDMQVQTRGEFGGLGIEVTMEDGVVKVIAPIDNTPADRAGVLAGDYITHLDGESIQGLTLNEAVEKMRGPVDSPITLTIIRKGVPNPIQTKVVRDIIRINPIKYSAEDGDVGWIKIKTFQSEHTYEYMKQAIDDLKKTIGPKLKGYVIDLRNNPGGLLDQAIAVSDAFLDKGAIVLTKGRNASESSRANAKPGDITDGKPIVVLINGGSASASEIVAGALQDHKRATVIGTRSFGKGSVQTMIPLGANGGLRLTTARYYTPSGRSIQATGIAPDYIIEPELPADMKAQMTAFAPKGEASLRGHLKNDSAPEATGSISYVPKEKEKDVQLKAGIDFLHGKKIESTNKKLENAAAPAAAVPN
jgi:carboxyl-terminal processing protease